MERVLLTAPAPAPAAPLAAAPVTTSSRLRPDARLTTPGDGELRITGPRSTLTLRQLPLGVRSELALLATGWQDLDALGARVVAADGMRALLRLRLAVGRLDEEGLLEHAVLSGESELARLSPVGRGRTVLGPAPLAGRPVKLSRFALAQVGGGRLTLAAPGSHLTVTLCPEASALLGVLADWTTPEAAGERLALAGTDATLRLLHAAGLLAPGAPGQDLEDTALPAAQWAPAELWLHARSRNPRTVAGYGGTYPGRDHFAPLPAAPPARGTRRVALPVPDLAAIARTDPSLTEVLESRRSVREHDAAAPLTDVQLGELLYRTARCRQTFTGGDGQELADRPYPSGGAVHELEVYPLVTACAGIEPGLWHYRTDRHELEHVAQPGPATAALVHGAREGALMTDDPQVVLLVAARFGRVMWKYETVAYPLLLKHVGVFYQTVYLVGAAMGLAVCGLGGGDAADFAAATGLDPLAEGGVGELVVGSRPARLRHPFAVPPLTAGAPSAGAPSAGPGAAPHAGAFAAEERP
ncbi:SagB family peptide dehydrogenase [Streptomyces sp. NPDC006660]|uniref:SagB family peptide dehydrogenase n=1 Tax=Streptomyces sp. NPDC006660 TaxID=3156901 RepID=UPI0033F721EF